MAQFVVRQLEEDLKERLKRRAERHGRSMEAEVREILRTACAEREAPRLRLGSRISARFRGLGLQADLPELRGEAPKPLDFDK